MIREGRKEECLVVYATDQLLAVRVAVVEMEHQGRWRGAGQMGGCGCGEWLWRDVVGWEFAYGWGDDGVRAR